MHGQLEHIDDVALVLSASKGDQHAFATLVRRHTPGVLRFVSRFCHDPAEMEDLVQKIFVKAYLNLHALRKGAVFKGWLHRIAANTCIDWLRRAKTESTVLDSLEDTVSDKRVQARAEAREAKKRLETAMHVLTPGDQRLLALLGLEGKTIEEVATMTGLTRGNVKVRAFRARRKLRAFLEKERA